MQYYFSPRMNIAYDDNDSAYMTVIYDEAKQLPSTATFERIAHNGVTCDRRVCLFNRSKFFAGHEHNIPYVVKIVSRAEEIGRVRDFLKDEAVDFTNCHHVARTKILDCENNKMIIGIIRLPSVLSEMKTPISKVCTCKLVGDILSGLEFLHTRGFAHMDVKVDNIAISENGNFVLIDLGSIARPGQPTAVTELYVPSDFALFVAEFRLDFWALALTLLRMRLNLTISQSSRVSCTQILRAVRDVKDEDMSLLSELEAKLSV